MGNCSVLTDTGYPCGKCPFYKPAEVFEDECLASYERLVVLKAGSVVHSCRPRNFFPISLVIYNRMLSRLHLYVMIPE